MFSGKESQYISNVTFLRTSPPHTPHPSNIFVQYSEIDTSKFKMEPQKHLKQIPEAIPSKDCLVTLNPRGGGWEGLHPILLDTLLGLHHMINLHYS